MSFRSYLVKINKNEAKELENMTLTEITNKYKIEDPYMLPLNMNKIFEFGAYSEFDKDIYQSTKFFFKKRETREYFEEYYFKKVSNKDFLKIIELIRKSIAEYSQELLNNTKKSKKYLENKNKKWNDEILYPYHLDKDGKIIIDDDSYEYNIFELIRIYNEFDFEKNIILFIGY